MKRLGLIALLVACAACSSDPDIHPALKDAIDGTDDCATLQMHFDNADRKNDVDVMKYADEAMRDAGCY